MSQMEVEPTRSTHWPNGNDVRVRCPYCDLLQDVYIVRIRDEFGENDRLASCEGEGHIEGCTRAFVVEATSAGILVHEVWEDSPPFSGGPPTEWVPATADPPSSLLFKRVQYAITLVDGGVGLVIAHKQDTGEVVVVDEDDGSRWIGYEEHVDLLS